MPDAATTVNEKRLNMQTRKWRAIKDLGAEQQVPEAGGTFGRPRLGASEAFPVFTTLQVNQRTGCRTPFSRVNSNYRNFYAVHSVPGISSRIPADRPVEWLCAAQAVHSTRQDSVPALGK